MNHKRKKICLNQVSRMRNSFSFVLFFFLSVFLAWIQTKRGSNESFSQPSRIKSLLDHMKSQRLASKEIEDISNEEKRLFRERRNSLNSNISSLNQAIKAAECLNLAQFESLSTSDLASMRHQDGSLMITKEYKKGEWDDVKKDCVSTSSGADKVNCSDYVVECVDKNSNRKSLRVGRNDANMEDTCTFDSCEVYCLSYDYDCWELKTEEGRHFFEKATNTRSDCVNPADEKQSRCVEPVVANCPEKEYFYYDDDNASIIRALQTVNLHDNVCVYTKSVTDRPTFDSVEEARSNCSGKSLTKTCHRSVQPGQYVVDVHALNRNTCDYIDEPTPCLAYDDITCPDSPVYYNVEGESFDSEAGIYRKRFSSASISQNLLSDGNDRYVCTHNKPPSSYLSSEVPAQCNKSCYMGDGTETPVIKWGSFDGTVCEITDCYNTSQRIDVSSCPEEVYYHFGTDNLTLQNAPKSVNVNDYNQCTYSIPSDAPVPHFETQDEALRNCEGVSESKLCYYPNSDGDLTAESHILNRNDCTYVDERPDCATNIQAGDDCSGSSIYYKTHNDVQYLPNGRAQKRVSSVELNNHLVTNYLKTGFECTARPPPEGYRQNAICEIDCYTSRSGNHRVRVYGSIEDGECVVPTDCYQSAPRRTARRAPPTTNSRREATTPRATTSIGSPPPPYHRPSATTSASSPLLPPATAPSRPIAARTATRRTVGGGGRRSKPWRARAASYPTTTRAPETTRQSW